MTIDVNDWEAIAGTLRKSISATVSEYRKRSNFCYEELAIPEYLLTVRMYDTLWRKLSASSKITQGGSRLSITLEPPTKDVKYWSGKRGRPSKVVAGNKRHDICIWSDDDPLCVIEVKRFTNRYGVLDEDVERLEATTSGINSTVQVGVLAFLGFWPYDKKQIAKFEKAIPQRFPNHSVCLQEILRAHTPNCDGIGTMRFLSGTISVRK